MKRTYFWPEEIVYTKAQLMFLLHHLHGLEAGCYPEIENEIIAVDPSHLRMTFSRRVHIHVPGYDQPNAACSQLTVHFNQLGARSAVIPGQAFCGS